MSGLKCGKASHINGLTAKHLLRAHPILPLILDKFLQLILKCKLVPTSPFTEIECLHLLRF